MVIEEIRATPLAVPVAPGQHRTSWGEYRSIGLLLVELHTSDGIIGYGEGLARHAPRAYAEVVDQVFAPMVLGRDPFEVARIWRAMAGAFSGRAGGIAYEALSAVDTALWDVMARSAGLPLFRFLGGGGAEWVEAYGSAVSWRSEETAFRQIEQCLALGLRTIKLKLGSPADEAIAWARRVHDHVGGRARLSADANGAFDLPDAVRVGSALADLGFAWFEEPFRPDDLASYRALAARVPIRLAAGEGEFSAATAHELLASGAIGLFQPDCARAGGITETRRMIAIAEALGIAYAPHVGGGGAVSAAANLHLAAASTACVNYECMIFDQPLRSTLAGGPVAEATQLVDGRLRVPQGPGLGIAVDPAVRDRFLVRDPD
ncbi:mandelate racemase/muconate lactonizing enzyme family protein [Falsiroseomonas oryzae]|uniref:mandelate racemase/muconate lactonizing enzyme family protein n=1 Tax=Falsiroseomonas oryzae TaxID=2766473 RepID=UPI0022EA39CE|nr:mandelate racemase/muconate lactonizing enzyme family protein [Roseomonas sp. MO-31]